MADIPKTRYRIALLDDHPAILVALSYILSVEEDLNIVGQAQTGAELLVLLKSQPVDLVILDLNLPDRDGLSLVREIRQSRIPVKILVYSARDEHIFARQAAAVGANGFLTKQHSRQIIGMTVRSILMGNTVFPVFEDAAPAIRLPANARMADLSPREMQILIHLAQGARNRDIAARLFVSEKTVAAHKRNLMEKLQVHNIAQIIELARASGLIP
jgi:two-component system response regulator FimZ (fimbrial Z protein)